jgi:hypothetical protein
MRPGALPIIECYTYLLYFRNGVSEKDAEKGSVKRKAYLHNPKVTGRCRSDKTTAGTLATRSSARKFC